MGCKLKLAALGPIVYGPPHPQQDPAQLRAGIASSIFALGACSSGGLTAAISPALFHMLLTCQPLSSHCKLFVTRCLPAPSLPMLDLPQRLQELPFPPCCRCFPEPAPAWFHCLCVTGQQSQCHCHSPVFFTVLPSPYPAHPGSQDPSDNWHYILIGAFT